jgi:glutathione S-transferase
MASGFPIRDVVAYPTLAVAASLLVYQYQCVAVSLARKQYGVVAPKTTGNDDFERVFRAQQNTLEALVIFVPSVYTFSYFVHPAAASVLGGVFAVGRLLYGLAYASQAEKRSTGFALSLVANVILVGGTIYGVGRHFFLNRPF